VDGSIPNLELPIQLDTGIGVKYLIPSSQDNIPQYFDIEQPSESIDENVDIY